MTMPVLLSNFRQRSGSSPQEEEDLGVLMPYPIRITCSSDGQLVFGCKNKRECRDDV